MSNLSDHYLQLLNIEQWVLREEKIKLYVVMQPMDDPLIQKKTKLLLTQMLQSVGLLDVAKIFSTKPLNLPSSHVKPNLMLIMGLETAHELLMTSETLQDLRHKTLSYHGTPMKVTHHPSSLLLNPLDKKEAFDDLSTIRRWIFK